MFKSEIKLKSSKKQVCIHNSKLANTQKQRIFFMIQITLHFRVLLGICELNGDQKKNEEVFGPSLKKMYMIK